MSGRLIERAFELAPEAVSLNDLRARLRREGFGYVEVQISLSGRLLKTQLNERLLANGKKRRVR